MFGAFKKEKSKFLIVGLGNPGAEYEYTRHNAGFMVIDYIAKILGIKINKNKYSALFGEGEIFKEKVFLIKPQTFMNASGEAVYKFIEFYKIPPKNLVLIFDDVSLDVGTLKIKRKGSGGGHNGVKSVINLIGTEDFPRIKIGVGAKPEGWDLANWVLSKFNISELDGIISSAERALMATELIVRQKIDDAMNKFN